MKKTNPEPKVACHTPAKGRDGVTNIPKWKYDLLRGAILSVVADAGPDGFACGDLKDAVRLLISEIDLSRLGSLGWHVTCVKLNMEVEGELARIAKVSPQRIVLTAQSHNAQPPTSSWS